jgi:RNA polymerase sigma-70 factor (ECF subfamily)
LLTARPSAAPLAAEEALDFDAVYAREFDFVYRVVSRLARSNDVDDLVQEVFVVVHRRLSEFRGDAQLTTWLFRIAYRVVGAHVRRERLRSRLTGWLVEAAAAVGGPPAPAELMSDVRVVRAALERLSFEKRSVLVLFEVEGWSGEEIAERLGVPVGTVYTRLWHARRDFKRVVDALAKGDAT